MKQAVLAVALLLLVTPAMADLGPKPTVSFDLEYVLSDNISVVDGDIYTCRAENCTLRQNASLREEGWRSASYLGFSCQQGRCDAINYGDGRQLLVLELSDGTRRTAFFEQYAFESRFSARIRGGGMELERGTASSTRDTLFLAAVVMTVLVELPVGILFLVLYTGAHAVAFTRRLAVSLAGVSLVTLPILWYVFPLLRGYVAPATIALTGELSAVLIEGLLLARLNPDQLSQRTGLLLAAVMNAATIALGLLWAVMS